MLSSGLDWEDTSSPYRFSCPLPFVLCDVSDFISPHAPTVMVNFMDWTHSNENKVKEWVLLIINKIFFCKIQEHKSWNGKLLL